MFTELTDELLDLTITEKGYRDALYAMGSAEGGCKSSWSCSWLCISLCCTI